MKKNKKTCNFLNYILNKLKKRKIFIEKFPFFYIFNYKKTEKSHFTINFIYVIVVSKEENMITKLLDETESKSFREEYNLETNGMIILKYNPETEKAWYSADYEVFVKTDFEKIISYIK